MKKRNIIKLIICSLALVLFLVVIFIKMNPDASDKFSMSFSSWWITFFGTINNIFPFSVFEILFFLLVIFLIFLLIRVFTGIKKHNLTWLSRLLTLFTVVFTIISLYSATFSVTYSRNAVPIPQADNNQINTDVIDNALKYYIDDFNTLSNKFKRDDEGKIISPYSFKEVSDIVNDEYKNLNEKIHYFNNFNPQIKGLIISPLFSEFHLTGITMSLTGEANFNKNISDAEKVFTLAHEFAHIKGVAKEDEANLTAAYILLNSTNEYLRYSGYFCTISSIIDAYNTTFRKSYSEKYPLSNSIIKEMSAVNTYWKTHDAMSKFADWWNDLYLKINGNQNGTDDYQDVSVKEDTGEKDENGNAIIIITSFSPYQKLLYSLYLS